MVHNMCVLWRQRSTCFVLFAVWADNGIVPFQATLLCVCVCVWVCVSVCACMYVCMCVCVRFNNIPLKLLIVEKPQIESYKLLGPIGVWLLPCVAYHEVYVFNAW